MDEMVGQVIVQHRNFQFTWFTIVGIALGLVLVIVRQARRHVAVASQCNYCGAENPRIANFCRQCGGRLKNR